MKLIKVENSKVGFFGNPLGSYKDKFNRATKLATQWDDLKTKFYNFTTTDKVTERHECALAMLIMMHTGVRIGNEDSAEGYVSKLTNKKVKTYGLTTLLRQHVTIEKNKVVLNFVGKRQVKQRLSISDPLLVSRIKNYLNNSESNQLFTISDYQLRKFTRKYVGSKYTVKDFRTVRANIEAWNVSQHIIENAELPRTKSQAKKEIKEITEHVSRVLGNTAAICKRSYVHSALLDFHFSERY